MRDPADEPSSQLQRSSRATTPTRTGARPPRRRRPRCGSRGRVDRRLDAGCGDVEADAGPPRRAVRGPCPAVARHAVHVRRHPPRRLADGAAARPVPLLADARRASTCTSSARARTGALGACSAPDRCVHEGVAGHRVLGVGAVGPRRARRRRLERLGRPGPPDADASASTACGSCSCPTVGSGARYKFEVLGADGVRAAEGRPGRPLVRGAARPRLGRVRVAATSGATTSGCAGAAERDTSASQRLSVYECHLGSWLRSPDDPDQLAGLGRPRPAAGRPRRGRSASPTSSCCRSWSTRSAARGATRCRATSRRRRATATPTGSAASSTSCTSAASACIVDWVPAHFPKDDFALARFDGTALYEHADPRQGEHPDWGTLVFNYGRTEVRNFLVANALYWIDEFHVDGLQGRRRGVDALPRLLAGRPASGCPTATAGARTSRPSSSCGR